MPQKPSRECSICPTSSEYCYVRGEREGNERGERERCDAHRRVVCPNVSRRSQKNQLMRLFAVAENLREDRTSVNHPSSTGRGTSEDSPVRRFTRRSRVGRVVVAFSGS